MAKAFMRNWTRGEDLAIDEEKEGGGSIFLIFFETGWKAQIKRPHGRGVLKEQFIQ